MRNLHHLLLNSILAIALTVFSAVISADKQQTIYLEGREIILKDNGKWNYQSSDRFITTTDGRRVRLQNNGNWQYVGNAVTTSDKSPQTAALDIKLQQVVIEKQSKKVQKNTRIKTQTVIFLAVNHAAGENRNIDLSKTNLDTITVTDSNDKSYPIISIKPEKLNITPDKTTVIEIRARKSPSVFEDTSWMKITLKPGFLNIQNAISFNQSTKDFIENDVDSFSGNK